jgi:hypothetical protein
MAFTKYVNKKMVLKRFKVQGGGKPVQGSRVQCSRLGKGRKSGIVDGMSGMAWRKEHRGKAVNRESEIVNGVELGAHGIQGLHTDSLLCAFGIRNNCSIFTLDKNFDLYKKYLKIRLHTTRKEFSEQ